MQVVLLVLYRLRIGTAVNVSSEFEDYAWQLQFFHPALNSELGNLKQKLKDSLKKH